eukprot:UC1_evm1s164
MSSPTVQRLSAASPTVDRDSFHSADESLSSDCEPSATVAEEVTTEENTSVAIPNVTTITTATATAAGDSSTVGLTSPLPRLVVSQASRNSSVSAVNGSSSSSSFGATGGGAGEFLPSPQSTRRGDKSPLAYALTELLATEETYTRGLIEICTGYYDSLGRDSVTAEEKQIIFGNLPQLCTLHRELCTDLREGAEDMGYSGHEHTDSGGAGRTKVTHNNHQLPGACRHVARCFLKRDFLAPYAEYCAGHEAGLRTLGLREADVDSAAEFLRCQRALQHNLPLRAFLLTPVQRMLKYPLLLDALVKGLEKWLKMVETDPLPPKEKVKALPTSTQPKTQALPLPPFPSSPPHPPPSTIEDARVAINELTRAALHMRTTSDGINRAKRERELEMIQRGGVVVVRTATLEERIMRGGFEGDVRLFGSLVDECQVRAWLGAHYRPNASSKDRQLYLFDRYLISCKVREENQLTVKDVFPLSGITVR